MMDKFVTLIEDPEWGNYYNLTVLGYTAIAVIMVLLLLIAVMLTSNKGAKLKTKDLAFCSLALALAYVTSEFIKLFKMPMGGSVTLFSMLFVTLIGYWYGFKTGLLAAVAYGVLQLVVDPYILSFPQVLFDYIFAFGALGLSGLFSKKKNGLIIGYLVGILGRLFFSWISGMLFFASSAADWNMSAPLYSFLYNGAYIGAEGLMTVIVLFVPQVREGLAVVKRLAVSDDTGR